MTQLDNNNYSSLKDFMTLTKAEISKQRIYKVLSEKTRMLGQEYGFCNEEIDEIVEECCNELSHSLYYQ